MTQNYIPHFKKAYDLGADDDLIKRGIYFLETEKKYMENIFSGPEKEEQGQELDKARRDYYDRTHKMGIGLQKAWTILNSIHKVLTKIQDGKEYKTNPHFKLPADVIDYLIAEGLDDQCISVIKKIIKNERHYVSVQAVSMEIKNGLNKRIVGLLIAYYKRAEALGLSPKEASNCLLRAREAAAILPIIRNPVGVLGKKWS